MNAWIRLIKIFILFFFFTTTAVLADEYHMPSRGDDIIGRNYIYSVKRGDSLSKIRKDHGVSYEELLDANPQVNFYKLKIGEDVLISKQFILPKIRRGIVINVPELRLYYFTPDGKYVFTTPVGLGRSGWRTPLFSSKIVRKKEDPTWNVPESIRNYVLNKTGKLLPDSVAPGPKNPLGKYALYLQKRGYLIHGTNKPRSVGTFISSGCMRLLRGPLEDLYEQVPIGTTVNVIHYPVKAGWLGNTLYLESHEPIKSYLSQKRSPLNSIDAQSAIYRAVHLRPARINWDLVKVNIKRQFGIPEPIGYKFNTRR